MRLVVFDLDGTLTRTNAVDGECFVLAVSEALEMTALDRNWDGYDHVTDEGIIRELYSRRLGRHPEANETARIVDRFMDLLSTRHASDTSRFSQVEGASAFVEELRDRGWGIALATGAWRRSAEFKIQRADLPISDLPAAYAEDGPSREGIVRAAIERAAVRYEQTQFERVISVGDALWDVKTARKLRIPFLGIADGTKAKALQDSGATHTVEDYRDPQRCLRYLEEAEAP